MRARRDERGLTLVELVLGAFILSLVGLGVNSVAIATFNWSNVGGALLQQAASDGRALQVLSVDLREPRRNGISIGGATYNTANTITLTWNDPTTAPVTQYVITYSISGSDLIRQQAVTQGGVTTTSSFAVARALDPAGASGGAQFSRTAGSPGVVRTLITIVVNGSSTTYDFTVEQRP